MQEWYQSDNRYPILQLTPTTFSDNKYIDTQADDVIYFTKEMSGLMKKMLYILICCKFDLVGIQKRLFNKFPRCIVDGVINIQTAGYNGVRTVYR